MSLDSKHKKIKEFNKLLLIYKIVKTKKQKHLRTNYDKCRQALQEVS